MNAPLLNQASIRWFTFGAVVTELLNYLRNYLGDVENIGSPGQKLAEPGTAVQHEYLRRYLGDI